MTTKVEDFVRQARKAKEISGKGYISQLAELYSLRMGIGKLGLQEYYLLGLYNDNEFDTATKKQFAGWKAQELYHSLNEKSWGALSNDKLAFHAYMVGQGAGVADIYAIYHTGRRPVADVPSFSDKSALSDFIKNEIHYPFFSKPVHSWSGMNAKLVERYDADSDTLFFRNGESETMDTFVNSLDSRTRRGHIFQEVIEPSLAVQAICGNRASSVRVVILNHTEPRILSAKWKLTVGKNMIDNTGDGSAGNIVAGIDENGRIERAYAGRVDHEVGWMNKHPDTGVEFTGMMVPEWKQIEEYTLRWARAFPGLKMQAWDVASTTKGIIALEVNHVDNTTVFSNQLVNRHGILTPELMEAVAYKNAGGR